MSGFVPDHGAIAAIISGTHGDPFAVLGPHGSAEGDAVRAFLPDAEAIQVFARDTRLPLGQLERVDGAGFWVGRVSQAVPYVLSVTENGRSYETEDPYSFPALLGELDVYLLAEGRHRDFAAALGAHVVELDGVKGVRFAVWAPNARRVSVVGDFNKWDGRRHPMRLRFGAGIWEIFIPRVQQGAVYKYEILGPHGLLPLKADPVAWATELPPATASKVADPALLVWSDSEWVAQRCAHQGPDRPMAIYEMQAMSWLPAAEQGGFGWHELADRLVPYLRTMGFTHVELMPIMEYPFGGSWGYQPLSQFAPTARLGEPAEFARFVDRCHDAGIGVILDWVPAHFPGDAHGLALFDGTPLYEHADPREGFHPDWNTYKIGRAHV